MKKLFISTLAICLGLSLLGCSSDATTQTQENEIPDLTGEWQQVNSNSENTYQTATITNNTIEVYWVTDDANSKSLYWAGTYVAPETSNLPYSWDSENDTEKTSSALLASDADTKTFTYDNNQISYEASALGETTTVQLERVAEVSQDNQQEEPSSNENSTETVGQKNALAKAKDYLDFTSFSYSGLIDQLEYEGFTTEEATYAVDNCGADWGEQAAKKAQEYLNYSSFSRSGLIGQLEYEGFTTEEATYAVDNCGADWNEQAAQKAQDYLNYSSFSRSGLIGQLEYEGFTPEQAEYGVQAVGY